MREYTECLVFTWNCVVDIMVDSLDLKKWSGSGPLWSGLFSHIWLWSCMALRRLCSLVYQCQCWAHCPLSSLFSDSLSIEPSQEVVRTLGHVEFGSYIKINNQQEQKARKMLVGVVHEANPDSDFVLCTVQVNKKNKTLSNISILTPISLLHMWSWYSIFNPQVSRCA